MKITDKNLDNQQLLSSDIMKKIFKIIQDKVDGENLSHLKQMIDQIPSITPSNIGENVRKIIEILNVNEIDGQSIDSKQHYNVVAICRQVLVLLFSFYHLNGMQIELLQPSIRCHVNKFCEMIVLYERQQNDEDYDHHNKKDNDSAKYPQQSTSANLLATYSTLMELLIIEDLIEQSTQLHQLHIADRYTTWYHQCYQIICYNNRKILLELMIELKDHLINYQCCYMAIDCLSQVIQSPKCSYDLKSIAIYGTECQPSITMVSMLGYKDLLDYCLLRLPFNTRQMKIVVYKWLYDMLAIIQLPSLSDTLRKPLYSELKQRLFYFPTTILRYCLHGVDNVDPHLKLILEQPIDCDDDQQRKNQPSLQQHQEVQEHPQQPLNQDDQQHHQDTNHQHVPPQNQHQSKQQQLQYLPPCYRCFIDDIFQIDNSITGQPFQLISLPYRFPDFMRNTQQIIEIEQHLKASKICAIQGEAGLGKTSLAVEYAYRHRRHYDVIYYFDASTILTLQRNFIRLGKELCYSSQIHSFPFPLYENLRLLLNHYNDMIADYYYDHYNVEDDNIMSLMDQVFYNHGWTHHPWLKSFISLTIDILQSHHSPLLIFDDIKYLQWIKTYLPGGENIHVIFIFDHIHNDDTLRFIKIKPLTLHQSTQYLQLHIANDHLFPSEHIDHRDNVSRPHDSDDISHNATKVEDSDQQYQQHRLNNPSVSATLLELCHGCPLLLQYVQCYTQSRQLTLEQFYQQIVNDIAPLTHASQSSRHLMIVAVALILMKPAINILFQQYEIATELIIFMSFVSPRHIDKLELLHYINYRGRSRDDLDQAIRLLSNYGLLMLSCHGYRLHSIIQNVVHTKLKEQDIYQQTIESILNYFLHQFEELDKVIPLYPHDCKYNLSIDTVVHAEYCCRYAGNWPQLIEVASKIKLYLAKCYLQSYCYPIADEYCQASLQYFINHEGETDSKTFQCYDILARVDYATGQFQSALEYILKLLQHKQQQLQQSHHLQLVAYYRHLFQLYCRLNRYTDAQTALQNIEIIYQQNTSSYYLARLYSQYYFISFYYFQGQYDQALQYCQQVLDLITNMMQQDQQLQHRHYLTYHQGLTYLVMAYISWSQNQLNQSIQHMNQSQTILKLVTLTNHSCRGRLKLLQGLIALTQGKYDEALDLGKQALKNTISNYGSKHIYVGRVHDIIGDFQKRLPDHRDLALKSYNTALFVKKGILNTENVDITTTYIKLGGLLRMMGKFDKAATLLEKSLSLEKLIFSDGHFQLSKTLDVLGRLYTATQDYISARKCITSSIHIKQGVLGDHHFNLACSYNYLGESYSIDGDHPQSLDHFGTAVALAMQVDDSCIFELARYYNNHAVAIFNTRLNYQDQNERMELVFHFLNQSLKIKLLARGEYSTDVEECYQNYAHFYQHLANHSNDDDESQLSEEGTQSKQYRNALTYYKKILKIQCKIYNSDHSEIIETCRQIVVILLHFKDYNDAIEHQKIILEIYKRRLGNDHVQIAICYYDMGEVYWKMQNKIMANICLQKALAIGNNCQELREDFLRDIKDKMKEINQKTNSRFCTLI